MILPRHLRLSSLLLFTFMFVLVTQLSEAQDAHASHSGFYRRYQDRVAKAIVNEPQWATPLVTTNARLEQGLRSDFVRQTAASGAQTWNLGNSKGLQFIPLPRTEIRFSPPPFFLRSHSKAEDGFGDVAFRAKVRLYGSNEQHHNAIVTAYLGASVPTGKSGNGSTSSILNPTLELGKGFGGLAMTTSAGASLPVSNTSKLGRSVQWNNAFQYHTTRLLWLQTEFNSTFYLGGSNDGKQQTFITPGFIVSRVPIIRGAPGQRDILAISFGGGEQIALTHFHTYNHSPILTARLRF
jgi:hypothetical protein